MNYYPVAYDTTYLTHGDGLYPLADITPLQGSARAAVITDEFLGQHWKKMVRQPIGNLKRGMTPNFCVAHKMSIKNALYAIVLQFRRS